MRGRSQEAFSLVQSLLVRRPGDPPLDRKPRNSILSTLADIHGANGNNQEVVLLLEEICSSNVGALSALDQELRSSALDLAEAYL